MLVRSPVGELRQIIEDGLAVRMENVRPVLVDQHAGHIMPVVGVAADMRAPIDEQHLVLALTCQPLGDDTAGEPGADHEPIIHAVFPGWCASQRSGMIAEGRGLGPFCGRATPRSVRPFAIRSGPTSGFLNPPSLSRLQNRLIPEAIDCRCGGAQLSPLPDKAL